MLGGQQGLLLGEVLLFLLHSPSRIGRKHSTWQGRPWTHAHPPLPPPPPRRGGRSGERPAMWSAGCSQNAVHCSLPSSWLSSHSDNPICPDVKQAKFLSLQLSHFW